MTKRKGGRSAAVLEKTKQNDEVHEEIHEEAPEKAPETRSGVLYSCGDGKVVLTSDPALEKPGKAFKMADGGECTINGKGNLPSELKRGDKVVMEGDPVSKITATR